ncbi:MAG: response regulator [Deltaproteobacteria bacterium]|nr:response regulator [Deltaproteobacteria bacterium]MBK8235041.1 response regulator [Deltaproteobacteria bacterium]MBK8716646.1 response regulator [Deltaproteobacteria bacterium]MBP7290175.1 response regulator [Nannocystaceae bacterium]
MNRILLLEDHATLRQSMSQALAALPHTAVTAVGTIARAKAALRELAHDLVVSDLDLPDGSGIELMGHHGCGSEIPIIYVSAHLPKFRAQLRDFPGITVREKPISLQELQRLATTHLEQAAQETEAPFGAGDYIQLACMGRHSVRIDVSIGDTHGAIVVRDGRLWSASVGQLRGVEALQELTFASHATVRCSTLKQTSVERSNLPDKPWEQLLLDAARQHDEDSRGAVTQEIVCADDPFDFGSLFDGEPAAPTTAAARTELEIPRIDDTTRIDDAKSSDDEAFLAELERGAEALLHKDYASALRAYGRAQTLRPHDRMVHANVERLTQLIARQNPATH